MACKTITDELTNCSANIETALKSNETTATSLDGSSPHKPVENLRDISEPQVLPNEQKDK